MTLDSGLLFLAIMYFLCPANSAPMWR